MTRRFLLLPLLLLVACQSSLEDREKEARAALDARDFAKARMSAVPTRTTASLSMIAV